MDEYRSPHSQPNTVLTKHFNIATPFHISPSSTLLLEAKFVYMVEGDRVLQPTQSLKYSSVDHAFYYRNSLLLFFQLLCRSGSDYLHGST